MMKSDLAFLVIDAEGQEFKSIGDLAHGRLSRARIGVETLHTKRFENLLCASPGLEDRLFAWPEDYKVIEISNGANSATV
jgi:hypothetical protein